MEQMEIDDSRKEKDNTGDLFHFLSFIAYVTQS